MSLWDRISLFERPKKEITTSTKTTKTHNYRARFSTEIVSASDVEKARSFFNRNGTTAFALGVHNVLIIFSFHHFVFIQFIHVFQHLDAGHVLYGFKLNYVKNSFHLFYTPLYESIKQVGLLFFQGSFSL